MISSFNHFKYRFKYRFGKDLPLTVPVDVSLELSSQCNMACEYCYHSDPSHLPFTKGIMSLETGKKIIEQAADLGVHSLKFNWKGESTINPHFKELTGYARSLARGSTFIDRLTNSNFKFNSAKEDIFEGLCNQTKVKVSFDSFIPEVFETQRAKGLHSLTMKNIDIFYHHPKRKNTELVIQAVRTKLNRDEDLGHEIKRRWPDASVSIRDMVEGRVEKNLDQFKAKARDFSERQSCIQAHVRLIFNWQGKAFPCCPDIGEHLCLGDINMTTLDKIFNGFPAKQLRCDLKTKKAFTANPCQGCSSFETFKGYKPGWNS